MTSHNDEGLELGTNGYMLRFPAVWLRDNCPCAECLDPGSARKLTDITELPDGVAVSAAEDAGESVVVTFAPDGHRSAFSRAWLAGHEGGHTGLVDGFAAARELRAADRETFDLIAETPVPFGYKDKSTELRASQPLIDLDPRGRIRGVRFNNRSAGPLRLPYAEVIAFYAAYRWWAELLAQPERQLNLRLGPGDCLVFDNTRVLHARTAFSVTGARHLQGCYADLDGLASTLALLARGDDPAVLAACGGGPRTPPARACNGRRRDRGRDDRAAVRRAGSTRLPR